MGRDERKNKKRVGGQELGKSPKSVPVLRNYQHSSLLLISFCDMIMLLTGIFIIIEMLTINCPNLGYYFAAKI